MTALANAARAVESAEPLGLTGRVASVAGLVVHAESLPAPVGALVGIGDGTGAPALGEVIGFTRRATTIMPLHTIEGVRAGTRVRLLERAPVCRVGEGAIGRVLNALGEPIDSKGPVRWDGTRALSAPPTPALGRLRITTPLETGVRAIDSLVTIGLGQRVGIFAGPGVGKSTLLGQLARASSADVNVIALIGERGREVPDFLHSALGEAGLARSVVIVATGDETPVMRVRAALTACALAEHFRDAGRNVLLTMDSVTRFAHAQRQIGLSLGEPPATRGYTPSVFARMSQLLERAGIVRTASGVGSITALYTVLVEGDDMSEPVSDAARGILDGHITLSRRIAQRGQFPAIDPLDSVSRVADDVSTAEHAGDRRTLVRMLAAYASAEELLQIGAYTKGSNPDADAAIQRIDAIRAFLFQGRGERTPMPETLKTLRVLVAQGKSPQARATR